jgi:hypothetical protein
MPKCDLDWEIPAQLARMRLGKMNMIEFSLFSLKPLFNICICAQDIGEKGAHDFICHDPSDFS